PEEAVETDYGHHEVRVRLRSGRTIKAQTVVLVTGYELLSPGQNTRHQVISTRAIATRPQPKGRLWPGEALIWGAPDPYLYLRTTHDGRIICGGEDADIFAL